MKKGNRLIDCRDAELGLLLKAMRVAKGISQERLATGVGVQRTSITNMEAGKQVVTLAYLVKAGDICGFDVRLRVERKDKRRAGRDGENHV